MKFLQKHADHNAPRQPDLYRHDGDIHVNS